VDHHTYLRSYELRQVRDDDFIANAIKHLFLIFFIFGTSRLPRRGAITVLVIRPDYKIAVALVCTRGADYRRALGFAGKLMD
jgi:hypothetical protein